MDRRDRLFYEPAPFRKKLLLNGKEKLIIWVVVNIEVWDPNLPQPRNVLPPPMGTPMLPDLPNWSWHEYGMRTGYWRFIDSLKNRNIKPTLALNGVVVDILFASSGIEDEICQKADKIEIFKDVSIPVAQIGHLIALKILSVEEKRPQDAMDLQNLIQVSTKEDLNLAMESCNLIQQRGFHHERDLTTLFKEYQKGFGNKEG